MGEAIKRKLRRMSIWYKAALVLALALTGATAFDAHFAYAATGDGRTVYSINTTNPQTRTYTGSSNTFNAAGNTAVGAVPAWMKVVAGKARNEFMAAYVDTANTLRVVYYNGTAWSNANPHDWTAALGSVTGRGFDMAMENLSGDIVIVYTTNAAGTEMLYRRWDGSAWSAAAAVDSGLLTGTVRFVRLAAKPNSDDLALAALDTNDDLTAGIWTGSTNSWGNYPGAALSTALSWCGAAAGSSNEIPPFDLAFEAQTGDLLVAWANDATTTGLYYNTYTGSGWGTTAQYANMNEDFSLVDCAADPLSNNIMCAAVGETLQDMRVGVWDGSAWQGTNTDVDAAAAPATFIANSKYIATGWLTSGSTKRGIIVYNDVSIAATNWVVVNENGTFTAQTDNTTAPTPAGGMAYIDIVNDPYNTDRFLLIYSNITTPNFYARRLVMDATPAFTWGTPVSLTAALTSAYQQRFHFAYDRYFPNATTPGTCSASATGATSIAVTMPYTDLNGNNTYTVEYKLSSSGTWTTCLTECNPDGNPVAHQASPASITITGLTGNTSYDVRCTWNDADGVNLPNPQTVLGITTPADLTTAGLMTASAASTTSLLVTMPYTDDANGNNTYTVDYKLSSSGTWINNVTAAAHVASPYTKTITGLTANSIYDIRGTWNDTDGVVGSPQIENAVYVGDPLLHSSGSTGSANFKYWSANGGWGMPGAKYGEIKCLTCHKPRATEIKGVKSSITSPNAPTDVFPGGAVGFRSVGVTNGFGDDTSAHTTSTKVCEVCHGAGTTAIAEPSYHRYNQTAATHYNNQDCTNTCHKHNKGFAGNAPCADCHSASVNSPKAAYLDAAVTRRRAIISEFGSTWSHKRSGGGSVTSNDCGVCHMEGAASDGAVSTRYHGNGYVELRDPDTGSTIKSVSWSGTDAGSYSSGSTDAKFVRFSRNLGSATIEASAAAIQINHCLNCHDSDGAKSAKARVPGGTAAKPFNTTISGSGYTGAGVTAQGVAGGVTDVKESFKTSNSSYHPVSGKQNNTYCDNDRMALPWNGINKTEGTLDANQWGYLMTCWDCHIKPTDSGTIINSVTAHGSAFTIFGNSTVSGTPSGANRANLCMRCHTGYENSDVTTGHLTGSALNPAAWGAASGMQVYLQYGCNICHSSDYNTAVIRPVRAIDVHGVNALPPVPTGGTANTNRWLNGPDKRPYAFIRNTRNLGTADPQNISGTAYTVQCYMGSVAPCSQGSANPYSPGGRY